VSLFKAASVNQSQNKPRGESEREREREMNSMKGEVVLNIPAEKAWEMYRDNDIISKINPQMLAGAEYIQGDGSPGSLRVFKLGPGNLPPLSLSLSNLVSATTDSSIF
jgi:hypothetical protein